MGVEGKDAKEDENKMHEKKWMRKARWRTWQRHLASVCFGLFKEVDPFTATVYFLYKIIQSNHHKAANSQI